MGGEWQDAMRELFPDWQPAADIDIEISNQRAAELTEARAEVARLRDENARLASAQQ